MALDYGFLYTYMTIFASAIFALWINAIFRGEKIRKRAFIGIPVLFVILVVISLYFYILK